MNRLRGGAPVPNYRRLTRVTDPALRGLVPAMAQPADNANQTVARAAGLLYRAGSSPRNPILAGIGTRLTFQIGDDDRLRAVYAFQKHGTPGPNLLNQLSLLGDNTFALDFLVGAGLLVNGSPAAGAVQNFLRIESKAGAFEKTVWAKSYDHDVVTVEGQNALAAGTLAPVEIVAQIIDASRDWLDLTIDFMVSWNDEFQVLHNRNAEDIERGNTKPYGGAKFVSFFQTGEDEGVGSEVNPVTKVETANQHTLQVENAVGLKHVTVRFRSKADSIYFVDVDILIRVIAEPACDCTTPLSERCGEQLLKAGATIPVALPVVASTPGVQVVAGAPGDPVARDLMYFAIHANTAGAAAKLNVKRFAAVMSTQDVAGFVYELISDLDYLPLTSPAAAPDPGAPYLGPVQMTVAFDKLLEKLAGVALYVMAAKDGDHVSTAQAFPGPAIRDTQFFPSGETGGTDECFYG